MSSGSSDQTIKIWSISTGQTIRIINTGSEVFSLKLLNNGVHLAAALGSFKIQIYNINTGNLVATLSGHTGRVRDLILLSNGGNLLASSSEDKTVRIWNLETNTIKFVLNGHTLSSVGLKEVSFGILASGSSDTMIKLWNTTTGSLIRTLSGHTGYVYESVDVLSDGRTLVSGSMDTTIKYWNTQTGQILKSINAGLSIWSLSILKSTRTSNKFIFNFYFDVVEKDLDKIYLF